VTLEETDVPIASLQIPVGHPLPTESANPVSGNLNALGVNLQTTTIQPLSQQPMSINPAPVRRRRLVVYSDEDEPVVPLELQDLDVELPLQEQPVGNSSTYPVPTVDVPLPSPLLAVQEVPLLSVGKTNSGRAKRIRTPSTKAIEASVDASKRKPRTPKSSAKEPAKKQLFAD
ncbi:unnamed protein product, partial [Linum tenue]